MLPSEQKKRKANAMKCSAKKFQFYQQGPSNNQCLLWNFLRSDSQCQLTNRLILGTIFTLQT